VGIGKILGYTTLGIVGSVAAVAAAPFTVGASLLGAATLATSLAGTGKIAGAYLAKRNDDENAELSNKLEAGLKKAFETFENDKEYFNFIIGMVALGLAMANVDGEISIEEKQEIDEFVNGISNSHCAQYLKDTIEELYANTPNLMTAMRLYVSKIDPRNYDVLRDFLHIVMLTDNIQHERELAFIAAFEQQILQLDYQPEIDDTSSEKLSKQDKYSKTDIDKLTPNEQCNITVVKKKSIFPFN